MGHTFNLSDNNANGVAGSVRTRATWINLAMTTLPADTVHATISELVRAYLAPDYRWHHDGDWHELHIGLQAPTLELLYPDRGTFGMLSAWHPRSVDRQGTRLTSSH